VSLETIWLNVARQAAEVTGVLDAYAPLTTQTTGVRDYVRIVDTGSAVIAWVRWTGSSLSPGSWEKVRHRFVVDLYARATDPATPYRRIAPMLELFIQKWRTNVDLYGSCTQCLIEGADEPVETQIGGPSAYTQVNDLPYVVLPIRIFADEERGVTYSP
jgi:hypothetical protein